MLGFSRYEASMIVDINTAKTEQGLSITAVRRAGLPPLIFDFYSELRVDITLDGITRHCELPQGYYLKQRKHLYKIVTDNCKYKPVWVALCLFDAHRLTNLVTVENHLKIAALDMHSSGLVIFPSYEKNTSTQNGTNLNAAARYFTAKLAAEAAARLRFGKH